MPNWYWARVCVAPMLIDRIGWKNTLIRAPATGPAKPRHHLQDAVGALQLGPQARNIRPELTVLAALPPRTAEMTCCNVWVAPDDLASAD